MLGHKSSTGTMSYGARRVSADFIIYRRRPAPERHLTAQEKIPKNRPVHERVSNSPVICKSPKSYGVSFILLVLLFLLCCLGTFKSISTGLWTVPRQCGPIHRVRRRRALVTRGLDAQSVVVDIRTQRTLQSKTHFTDYELWIKHNIKHTFAAIR